MADIFISYAREDREWVEKLASQLVAEGFSVWWDWDLLVGKRYRETIETELQTAKAAVVVWSQHSIRSDFVRDEAEDAQQRNILLPLLKEIVRPPAGFRQLQTADLSAWHGGGEHIEFRRMMKGVSSLVGRASKGDTGVIPVDPSHPTTHFEEQPAAPQVITASEIPAAVEAKVPEAVPVAPPPVPVAPPAATPIAPASAAATKASNPIIKYVAIGVVALLVLVVIAAQFMPASKPTPPPTPAIATPAAHPAPLGMRPAANPPPASAMPAGGAGGDSGADEGQAGPHNSGAPTTPAHPSSNGGDDSGTPPPNPPPSDDGGDVGQGSH